MRLTEEQIDALAIVNFGSLRKRALASAQVLKAHQEKERLLYEGTAEEWAASIIKFVELRMAEPESESVILHQGGVAAAERQSKLSPRVKGGRPRKYRGEG